MLENLKSQDFKNDISKILNKNIFEITEDDLKNITRISLSKENIFGKITDYQISDLKYLNELKECSLSGFEITDQDISIINDLPELEFLSLDFCSFKLISKSINNLKLEELYLDKCIDFSVSNINSSNLKFLSIIGFKDEMNSINFNDLVSFYNMEVLSVHNYKIENIENVINSVPNVKILNLDGSIIDEKTALENLSLRNVEVSNESFFHLH